MRSHPTLFRTPYTYRPLRGPLNFPRTNAPQCEVNEAPGGAVLEPATQETTFSSFPTRTPNATRGPQLSAGPLGRSREEASRSPPPCWVPRPPAATCKRALLCGPRVSPRVRLPARGLGRRRRTSRPAPEASAPPQLFPGPARKARREAQSRPARQRAPPAASRPPAPAPGGPARSHALPVDPAPTCRRRARPGTWQGLPLARLASARASRAAPGRGTSAPGALCRREAESCSLTLTRGPATRHPAPCGPGRLARRMRRRKRGGRAQEAARPEAP